jgi:hypothetical protein
MFETIYSCLLRLFPPAFRRQYQEESLRLLRDRLRDEASFLRRLRLVLDLVVDIAGVLPQAYRNTYVNVTTAGTLTPQLDGVPSFRTLNQEPIRREVIFIASICAMTGLAIFAFVMGRPAFYRSAAWNGRRSPIESVIEHLNQPTSPESADNGYSDAPAGSSPKATAVHSATAKPAASPLTQPVPQPAWPAEPGPIAELVGAANNASPDSLAPAVIAVNLSGRWNLLSPGSSGTAAGEADLPRWFHFAQDSTRLTGTAGTDSTERSPILHGFVDGGSVSFEVQNKQSTFRYDLRLEGKVLRGTLSVRSASGTSSTNVWLQGVR